ncbi:MAG: twin-arginine translocation signal domain-containing protein, partial [Rhodoferax sp.]|nr:twin-arginine translocation signal domain-containing protein [Rhodoferax sp.]
MRPFYTLSGVLLMTTVFAFARRNFLKKTAVAAVATALPAINFAQSSVVAAPAERQFSPQPGNWRTFEVTTRVDIVEPQGVTRVWLPIPSVNTDWQKSLESSFSSN